MGKVMRNLIFISLLILTSFNIYAAPQGSSFTYQGELIENGVPANGNFDMDIFMYDTSTAGNLLQVENFSAVTVANGLFAVEIDIGTGVFNNQELWLEVNVFSPISANWVKLTPRQKITNTPYAIESKFVAINGVDTLALADGAVTSDKIGFRAVTSLKVAANSIESPNIVDGTIINSDIKTGTITAVQLAGDSVSSIEIQDGAVINSKLASNSVGTLNIIDSSIVAADIDNTSIQQRVSGICAAGSSIRIIATDGTVTCETDDSGSIDWGLNGNVGTIPGTHFIGTTDDKAFVVKVNNKQALKIMPASDNTFNFLAGNFNNFIHSDVNGSVLFGGGGTTDPNFLTENFSVIAGGINNSIGSVLSNHQQSAYSVISGGLNNSIDSSDGQASTIGGGTNNIIDAKGATIPGGSNNTVSGDFGFAAGYSSKVNHTGGFVWNDRSDTDVNNGLSTTADNQFIVRAEGGLGVGTNAPASPIHIKGQGTSTGSITGSNEVVMTLEPKVSTDSVAAVINRLDGAEEAALIFSTSAALDYDLRLNSTELEISYYDAVNTQVLLTRYNGSAQRIDINADMEPLTADTFELGDAAFRWKHIYTENITTRVGIVTDSDKRLKDNIEDINYGLAEVLSMRPVSYQLKKDAAQQLHLGFIAQEVETIIPEIVRQTTDEKHMRSMSYSELIPVLIKATQEQQTLIEQQTQQIKSLQTMVNALIENKNNK